MLLIYRVVNVGASLEVKLTIPFRILQPPSHLLVLRAVARPTLCSTVPAVVLDGHVDAAVDQELHRLVAPVEDQVVHDGSLQR